MRLGYLRLDSRHNIYLITHRAPRLAPSSSAQLLVAFRISLLCLKLNLLTKKRAMDLYIFKRSGKENRRRDILFVSQKDANWSPSLPSPRFCESGWLFYNYLVICLMLLQGPFQLVAQGQRGEASYSPKGCIFKRHFAHSISQRNNHCKSFGTLIFHIFKIFIFNPHGHRFKSNVKLVYVGQSNAIQDFLLVPCYKGVYPTVISVLLCISKPWNQI